MAELEFEYLGNFSVVDPVYSVSMSCDKCRVRWIGCWDNFQYPKCGEGELPSMDHGFGLSSKVEI